MAAIKLKVTYVDGREVTVLASPRAQVETERHFKGIDDAQRVEASFYLAWASLHYAGKEPAAYEAWLDLVTGAEEVEAAEDETDPTPPVQSTTGSSD
jgi:hypothetical protein